MTDFLIAGDICDLSTLADGPMDLVAALTVVTITLLNRSALLLAIEAHPRLAIVLMSLALKEQAILRMWLACLGGQERIEHVAHLFCELHERLRRAGLVGDHSFDLPLTQEDIAAATGMSLVHVNRLLQRLRKDGLISLQGKHLRILEPQRFRHLAEFDPAYLGA